MVHGYNKWDAVSAEKESVIRCCVYCEWLFMIPDEREKWGDQCQIGVITMNTIVFYSRALRL